MDDKKWGSEERERLYQGLEKHGVGKWSDINAELLPKWDEQALRIKATKLLGSQSLARYVGWKGDRSAATLLGMLCTNFDACSSTWVCCRCTTHLLRSMLMSILSVIDRPEAGKEALAIPMLNK